MAEKGVVVENIKKHFPVNQGIIAQVINRGGEEKMVKAVDGVSFEINKGESLGFAGESGCGKTTLGKTTIRLLEPTAGNIWIDGEEITDMEDNEPETLRRNAQIIHQDPYESINPRFTVRRWVREPLDVHNVGTREEREAKVRETLEKTGLRPADAYIDQRTPELSGGERQRVSIARALVLDPKLLLADEPASMLDVSLRADILNLLKSLQDDMGLTSIYISHDLSLLKHMCDRIAIMYLGRIVEIGTSEQIIHDPKHPYTKALVSSIPKIEEEGQSTGEAIEIEGEVPDPIDLPSGCRFAPRCPEAMEECKSGEPRMYELDEEIEVRCILYDKDIQQ